MWHRHGCLSVGTLLLLLHAAAGPAAAQGPAAGAGDKAPPAGAPAGADGRGSYDSFRYYGPNGLWKTWSRGQKEGRDTWIMWTGGNQKFLRWASEYAAGLAIPVSIEMFRVLDSRERGKRFERFGLINEPNCEAADQPDEFGLYLDRWKGDAYRRGADGKDPYPGGGDYAKGKYPYYPDPEAYPEYGEPTGVVGLRKFKNPLFDRAKWDVKAYFASPGKVQPPYLVGFSCAFCHMSFDPTNPPQDPANPRWENLAANLGNQYFREGDLFLGRGRIVFGDRNPDPKRPGDPYATRGVGPGSLLYHYAVTQAPGTSETSRISYDFINNPTIINSIINLAHRPTFVETTPDGKPRPVNHVLADGADSVGLPLALLRVWINIGCEGLYWKDTLFNPVTGERQRPLDLDELLLTSKVSDARKKELEATYGKYLKDRYGKGLGEDWKEAWRRNPHLVAYLTSYGGYPLKNALARLEADAASTRDEARAARLRDLAKKWRPDPAAVERGKRVFAKNCVECHSSKLPTYPLDWDNAQHRRYLEESVLADDFLTDNTLSNDRRYSVARLGTNMGRALATNAVDGDVWARFSSVTYKSLPPVGTFDFRYAFDRDKRLMPAAKGAAADVRIRFTPPGGGRGYYRSPTLVSTWATAPYLHNNSVGDYCVVTRRDPKTGDVLERKLVASDSDDLFKYEIDTSVEGRLLMFQDGIERLLGLKERRQSMLRTGQDCDLVELQPVFRQVLPGVLHDWAFAFLRRRLDDAAAASITDERLAPEQAKALRQHLEEFGKELDALHAKLTPADLAKLRERVGILIKTKLIERAGEVLPREIVKAAVARFEAVRQELGQEVAELVSSNFLRVPRGTPVNLYFNLPASAVPYALKAHILYRNDPQKRYEALLRLSDCPDLIEDRGHEFGAALTVDQRRDLIEFLKTF